METEKNSSKKQQQDFGYEEEDSCSSSYWNRKGPLVVVVGRTRHYKMPTKNPTSGGEQESEDRRNELYTGFLNIRSHFVADDDDNDDS
jgi:hypothetical protein